MTAATGRPDYDQLFRTGALQPEEPRFVLHAGDAVAADAVRGWALLAFKAGTPAEAIELALQQADRMAEWPTKKIPDGPELSASDRLNLRNVLGRRAWNARETLSGHEAILAQRLGADDVLGRLRPLLTDLAASMTREGVDLIAAPATMAALQALFAIAGQDLARQLEANHG